MCLLEFFPHEADCALNRGEMASFNNSSKRGWKSMQGSESGGGSSSRCGGQRNEADSTISFPTSLLRTKKVDGKICEKGRSRVSSFES